MNTTKRETSDSCQAFGKFDDVHSKNTNYYEEIDLLFLTSFGDFYFYIITK
jgi:hypothetical protein